MQIAASEAKKGHSKVAQELKELIGQAKSKRKLSAVSNVVQHPASREFKEIEDLVEVVEHKSGLNSMVLHTSVRQQLERIIREQRKFDELRQYNLMPRRKLLLTGPPGCGKTMTAEALVLPTKAGPLLPVRIHP